MPEMVRLPGVLYYSITREGRVYSHGEARLTLSQVDEIRGLRGLDTQAAIGRKFGVSRGCVQAILNGKSWRSDAKKKPR